MTETQVLTLLEKNKNDRGIEHWKRLTGGKKGRSFGIGLTQLRKLAKKVGRDHDLAAKLWKSDVVDAKIVSLLIDEPARMTRAQVEKQVDGMSWMLAHVFCSCDATLTRTPFMRELAVAWADSKDDTRRQCGYLLIAELAKDKKDPALDDAFFEPYVERIAKTIRKEENLVRDAMNMVIFAAGGRSAKLNKKAIAAAKAYWPIQVSYGGEACEPLDVLKHLTKRGLSPFPPR